MPPAPRSPRSPRHPEHHPRHPEHHPAPPDPIRRGFPTPDVLKISVPTVLKINVAQQLCRGHGRQGRHVPPRAHRPEPSSAITSGMSSSGGTRSTPVAANARTSSTPPRSCSRTVCQTTTSGCSTTPTSSACTTNRRERSSARNCCPAPRSTSTAPPGISHSRMRCHSRRGGRLIWSAGDKGGRGLLLDQTGRLGGGLGRAGRTATWRGSVKTSRICSASCPKWFGAAGGGARQAAPRQFSRQYRG